MIVETLRSTPRSFAARISVPTWFRLRIRNPWLVFTTALAAALVITASVWVYLNGLQLLYADAATHLNLARRVFDSLTPGLGQIGAYWLWLVHVAELPFVWNDFMWHTGLAGTIVSAAAFIGAVYFTFRLGYELTRNNVAAFFGALVMALNPNFLFLSAMPMFEAMLLCTWIAAIYYAVRWAAGNRYHDLIACSIWTLLATLVRHDNWVLLPSVVGLIVITTGWLRREGRAKLESNLILYGVMAFFGVALYLLWNYISYGDALWFLHPSHIQRSRLLLPGLQQNEAMLPNLLAFPIAAYNSVGGVVAAIAIIGLLDFLLSENRGPVMMALLLSLTSFIFFTVMVFQQGESWILTQDFDVVEFNQRYGLDVLPAAAVFVAFLARRGWAVRVLVGLLVLAAPVVMIATHRVVAFNEPTTALYRADNLLHVDAGKYLKEHYRGGAILMSNFAGGDLAIVSSGLDNREFISESNQDWWTVGLRQPEIAAWVLTVWDQEDGPNIVYRAMAANPTFESKFGLVYGNLKYSIYVRRDVAAAMGISLAPSETNPDR